MMKKLLTLLMLLGLGYVGFSQVYDYQVQAADILQADNYFVWQGDTIRKDSIVYVDNQIDSIRVKYINGAWSNWFKNAEMLIKGNLTENIAGLEFTDIRQVIGGATTLVTSSGYSIPTTASQSAWDSHVTNDGDLSATNELQTISTTGAAGNITLSNSGGTLNLNVDDADASITNEIQAPTLIGNTLGLTQTSTTVDLSAYVNPTSLPTPYSLTMNNSGTGDASGATFNGSAAKTISYNTIGAAPATGSGNYIQNGITLQSSANSYIDGVHRAASFRSNRSDFGTISTPHYDVALFGEEDGAKAYISFGNQFQENNGTLIKFTTNYRFGGYRDALTLNSDGDAIFYNNVKSSSMSVGTTNNSYPVTVKGINSSSGYYSFQLFDSNDRSIWNVDNSGRSNLVDYSGVGGVMALYNLASPVDGLLAGHYAFGANNSNGDPNTIGYIANNVTDTSVATMSSKLTFGFMDNMDTSIGYSQPNRFAYLDKNALDIGTLPIVASTGKFSNLTNGFYPKHLTDTDGLVDGGLYTDGYSTSLGMGASVTESSAFEIAKDVPGILGYAISQFAVRGLTDQTKEMMIGFETTNNFAFLQPMRRGIAYGGYNISLIPVGSGNAGIGYSTGTEIDNHRFAVNGSGYFNGTVDATGYKQSAVDLRLSPLRSGYQGASGTIPVSTGATTDFNWSAIKTINGNSILGSGDISVSGTTNLSTTTSTTTVTIVSDSGTDAVIPAATTGAAGVLTASDKTKLDGIASGADNYGGWNLYRGAELWAQITSNENVSFNGSDGVTMNTSVDSRYNVGFSLDIFGLTTIVNPTLAGFLPYTTTGTNAKITLTTLKSTIGSTAGTADLLVMRDGSGDAYAHNFILSSDRRLKRNIKPLSNTEWTNKIQFKEFQFKNDPAHKTRYGIIAQDVEKIAPELVTVDSEGNKSVAYIDLLIAKIVEMDKRMIELEKRIEKLERK